MSESKDSGVGSSNCENPMDSDLSSLTLSFIPRESLEYDGGNQNLESDSPNADGQALTQSIASRVTDNSQRYVSPKNLAPGAKGTTSSSVQDSADGFSESKRPPVCGVVVANANAKEPQRDGQGQPVPDKARRRRLNKEDIEILAEYVGDCWRKLARLIGIKKGQIENILHDYKSDQKSMVRAMLDKWVQIYGRNASIENVVNALQYLNLQNVIDLLPAD